MKQSLWYFIVFSLVLIGFTILIMQITLFIIYKPHTIYEKNYVQ